MAAGQRDRIVGHLRTLAGDTAAPDADLLARFLTLREEAAFAALVQRHGPLVLGVCRRLLRHAQDAEDAFQATFLVLARKAASIRNRESLGAFLYEVAYRIAARMRADEARRKRHERQASEEPAVNAAAGLLGQELAAVLDEELNRLPEKYRRPLVLCHLQGKTHAQAARELGVPSGSLSRHMQRARELLRERLAGRGFTFSAALLGTVLAEQAAPCVPLPLVAATARAALLVTAGEVAEVSARAAGLAEGMVKTLFVAKLKLAIVLLAVSAVLAAGMGVAVRQSPAAKPAEAARQAPKAAPDPKPRTDRWGDPLPPGAVDRLGTLRFRHDGEAGSLVFSPDGKLLAATSKAGVVHLWDARTGKELRRFRSLPGTMSVVNLIDFSPDGKVLAAPADDQRVALWDVATGKPISTIELPNEAGPRDPLGSALYGLRFSPDGKVLAVSRNHGSCLFDTSSGKMLHDSLVLVGGWTFTPDGQALVAGLHEAGSSKPVDVLFRSVRTGEVLRRLKGESPDFVRAIALSPDGKVMATGSKDRVLLWDVVAGKVVRRIEAKMGQPVALSFTPDGRTLVGGCEVDGKVHAWDASTGKEVRQLDARQALVRSTALSPDGKTVAAGGVYNAIRLWDLTTGLRLSGDQDVGHDAPVNSVAFTPDGKWIISGGDNHRIQFWDARNGDADHGLWCPLGHVIALSGNGQRLASLGPWNNEVDLWDVATGQRTHLLPGTPHMDSTNAIVLSPDGRTLVSSGWKYPAQKGARGGSGKLLVWDAATGRLLRPLTLGQMRADCLAYSPDGKTLAAGGAADEGPIRLWDMHEGREIVALVGHQPTVAALAFAPDGRTLVSGGYHDQTVRLWEVASGKEIFTLRGHERAVAAVAFSPDGRIFASADGDDRRNEAAREPHRIRLWDAATGDEIQCFQGHGTNVNSLAFSPDGRRLVSGLRDSTILIWEVPAAARAALRPDVRLTAGEMAALWADLAGGDARKAHAAIGKLAAAPAQAVPFLAGRLAPAAPLDEARVRRLIAALDSDKFDVRQAALQGLEDLGEAAVPLLRQAVAGKPPLEVRKRLEELVAHAAVPRGGEVLRGVRALAVLERTGTPEARQLLQKLARGAPASRLTQDAKASLDRLAR